MRGWPGMALNVATGGGFTPARLSGLTLWAEDGLSPIGGPYDTWTDNSPSAFHGAQSHAGRRPTVGTINGAKAAVFSGAEEMNFGDVVLGSATILLGLVYQGAAGNIGTNIMFSKAFAATAWEIAGDGAGKVHFLVGAGTKAISNAAIDDNTPHSIIVTYATGANNTKMYIDGTLQATTGTAAGAIPVVGDTVCVGAYASAADLNAILYVTGKMASVVGASSFGGSDVSNLYLYHKAKFATP